MVTDEKNRMLLELFERKGLIRIMGAHNGLSAKLVEEAGFDGIWASECLGSISYQRFDRVE